MLIGSYLFEYICRIEPVCEADGSIGQRLPQARYVNKKGLPLHTYGHGPFCKFKVPTTYRNSGVYALQVAGLINYIGECVDLSDRYNGGYGNISPRHCFKGGQQPNCRINNLIYVAAQAGKRVDLWFYRTNNHKAVEKELLAFQRWPWNLRFPSGASALPPDDIPVPLSAD
jgi:hypothetical protein